MVIKKYKQTIEHKNKRLNSFKTNYKKENHYNYGKHLSKSTRTNIGNALKGKKYSAEKYPNFGMRGKHYSKESKEKMSETRVKLFREGLVTSPLKGKHHSKESKLKMRESRLMGLKEGRIKIWNKGLKDIYSEEVLKKMSEGIKNNMNKPEVKIKLSNSLKKAYKEGRLMGWRTSRKNQIFPIKDTSIELKIQNFLEKLQIEYFKHKYMNIKHGYQCDIFIPQQETEGVIISQNTIIECDGCYWHKYPIGTEIDNIRTKELIEKGYKVIRLWEHDIKKMELNEFKEKIEIR